MLLNDVVTLLDKVLPKVLIEPGDNSGLLIGDMSCDIGHIRTALEATEDVVDAAIADGVDLLIVHHPMIFTPMTTITSETVQGRKAMKMIQSGMALFAAHSNLDRTLEGLNQKFGHRIGIHDSVAYDDEGYILVGRLEVPIFLKDYVEKVAKTFNQPFLKFVGKEDKTIEQVAFCTGSGMGLISDNLFDKADVYITGDLKYHDAMDVYEKGQAVIDVPHFISEEMATEVLFNLVTSVIDSVRVTKDISIVNPFRH